MFGAGCSGWRAVVERVYLDSQAMSFTIEFEREVDGRWIAEIPELPGVMVYGSTKEEAQRRVEELARRVQQSADLQGRSDQSLGIAPSG